jgi:glycerol transport system ATP-binding protein
LLDEPLTVIDPVLKLDLRRKLRLAQQELKLTMIYVTHDQHEALTFADHVTIMKDGAVMQSDTPEALFLKPRTPFVGYFIGSPGMNRLPCEKTSTGLSIAGSPLAIPESIVLTANKLNGVIELGIRPEFVETSIEKKPGWNRMAVRTVDYVGGYQVLNLESGTVHIKARVEERFPSKEGDFVWARFPADKTHLYANGERVDL